MTSKTLTDKHGDVITISDEGLTLATRGHVVVHVKETTPRRVHTAAAYADPAQLRAALDEVAPAGSYARTDEEDWQARAETAKQERDHLATVLETTAQQRDKADAANAGLQAEVGRWKARAEKVEQERDVLAERVGDFADSIREQQKMIDRLRAEQPRPLTADDITDEMVERARKAWNRSAALGSDLWRDVLTAALTPARPEGAEELARLIATADVGEWDCGDLADALLATGRVRVVTEEQP